MTAVPDTPARKVKIKKSRPMTFTQAVGIPAPRSAPPANSARDREIARYAERGAETYTDRRLLDIAESVAKIQFWVTLWSVLAVVVGGLALLLFVVAAVNNSS